MTDEVASEPIETEVNQSQPAGLESGEPTEFPASIVPDSLPPDMPAIESASVVVDMPAEIAESKTESSAEQAPIQEAVPTVPPSEVSKEAPPKEDKKRWYVVKVQSNREDSIKAAIERRVKIEGLEEFFGEVLIPTEKIIVEKEVTERNKLGEKIKKKKKVFKDVKKFPGYLFAFVEYNLQMLALFRETSGVGDFVGASLTRDPIPMSDREVALMLKNRESAEPAPVIPQITFNRGDRVKVRDGSFVGMEGEIKEIVDPKDAKDTYKVKLELTILGRSVPVELEHWQVEAI